MNLFLRTEHCTPRRSLPLLAVIPPPLHNLVLVGFSGLPQPDERYEANRDENQSNLTIPETPSSTILRSLAGPLVDTPESQFGNCESSVMLSQAIPLFLFDQD